MITGSQMRGARGMLGWSIQKLADEAGVSVSAVQRAERSEGIPNMRTASLFRVRQALERAGVIFIDSNEFGAGVRLRTPSGEH
jgi:transcriptional regulator with XRE-family HTH domain